MKRIIPKKYLSQNFLVDHRIREKIISACDLKQSDIVLEIGPGQGALTTIISSVAHKIIAIEKDVHLVQRLKQQIKDQHVNIIHGDFLAYPFSCLPCPLKVIGNLPYHITTPILEKLIAHRQQISCCYLTVQWEYAQRLLAEPHTKEYGALTCFIQYYGCIEKLLRIKNTAFRPIPKVHSCLIKLKFIDHQDTDLPDEKFLFQVIHKAFGQRRKTILNSLQSIISKDSLGHMLKSANISPLARAENLALKDYINLTKLILEQKK